MSVIRMLPGQYVVLDDVQYRTIRRTGDGRVAIEDVETRAQRNLTDAEIAAAFSEGRLSFMQKEEVVQPFFDPKLADFELLDPAIKAEARRRYAYVVAVLQADIPLSRPQLREVAAAVAAAMSDPKGASPASLKRWVKKWVRGGMHDLRLLVPDYHQRGCRKAKLPDEVFEVIEGAIIDVYERSEKTTKTAVIECVRNRINDLNARRSTIHQIPIPSDAVVRRFVNLRDRYDLMCARQGKKAADLKYKPVMKGPRVSAPLERVEVDSTPLDLLVIDEATGAVLGRPTLTMAFDCYSTMPLGYYLGFEPPGTAALMQCLRHAILDKSYVKEKYPEIEGEWPCFGAPYTVVVDQAAESHSASFKDAMATLGAVVAYMPVGAPWYKPRVERFFGTINTSLIHQTPGTTFSDILERADYDPEKTAVLTIDGLHLILHMWIVDYYGKRLNKGIGDIPVERWKRGCLAHSLRLPKSLEDLDCLLGGFATRTISNKGIELHGLLYNDEEIKSLRRRSKDALQVHLRYDLGNLGRIKVLDPVNLRHFPVPAVDPEYAEGLSLAQHRAIRNFAAAEIKGRIDMDGLARARTRIREVIGDAFIKARRAGIIGKRIARLLGLDESKFDKRQAMDAAASQYSEGPQSVVGTAPSTPTPKDEVSERKPESAASTPTPQDEAPTGESQLPTDQELSGPDESAPDDESREGRPGPRPSIWIEPDEEEEE
jgi:putative transposase